MSGKLEIAVLADIHGNYLALKACLDCARRRGIRHFLFLGDYITDHAYPQRVLEQLYEIKSRYDCRFIRGNREEYMIGYRANGEKQGDGTPPLTYCHGSPARTKARIANDPAELEQMASLSEGFLIAGHTHRFRRFWVQGKQIVCAGSVGIPTANRSRRSGPKAGESAKIAQMVLLRPVQGTWRAELLCIPYDWQGAIDNLKTSGLTRRAPVWAAMLRHAVLTGEDPFSAVPERAAELYREEAGKQAGWAQVPEGYWRRAAGEFGIELWK